MSRKHWRDGTWWEGEVYHTLPYELTQSIDDSDKWRIKTLEDIQRKLKVQTSPEGISLKLTQDIDSMLDTNQYVFMHIWMLYSQWNLTPDEKSTLEDVLHYHGKIKKALNFIKITLQFWKYTDLETLEDHNCLFLIETLSKISIHISLLCDSLFLIFSSNSQDLPANVVPLKSTQPFYTLSAYGLEDKLPERDRKHLFFGIWHHCAVVNDEIRKVDRESASLKNLWKVTKTKIATEIFESIETLRTRYTRAINDIIEAQKIKVEWNYTHSDIHKRVMELTTEVNILFLQTYLSYGKKWGICTEDIFWIQEAI